MKSSSNSIPVEFLTAPHIVIQNELIVYEKIVHVHQTYELLYGKLVKDNTVVCVRRSKKHELVLDQVKREVTILSNVSHPNIIRFYGYYQDFQYFYFVTEVPYGGKLLSYLENQQHFEEYHAQQIVSQILRALNYLHHNRIAFNSLKGDSVVLIDRQKPGRSTVPMVKLINFSNAIIYNRSLSEELLLITPTYCAPEIIQNLQYATEPDIYALGILVHLILTGQLPYNTSDPTQILQNTKNSILQFSKHTRRPDSKTLLQHPWLSEQNKARQNFFQNKINQIGDHLTNIFNKREDLKNYKITSKVLGKGGYGEVRVGVHKVTKEEVAIKIIKQQNADISVLEREIGIMKSMNCQYIVKCYDFEQDYKNIYIVTELANGGELGQFLMTRTHFFEEDIKNIVIQILQALHYMHFNKITHFDLKPNNIMLKEQPPEYDQSVAGNYTPKLLLVDFGTAVAYKRVLDETVVCGTPGFMAPEVILNYKDYSTQPDIYAVGVIAFLMLSGQMPFQGSNARDIYLNQVRNKWRFCKQFKYITKEAQDFISQALTYDFRKRPSAEQLLQHNWLSSSIKQIMLTETIQQVRNTLSNSVFQQMSKLQQFKNTEFSAQESTSNVQDEHQYNMQEEFVQDV